jgi:uncharacterized membrane protein
VNEYNEFLQDLKGLKDTSEESTDVIKKNIIDTLNTGVNKEIADEMKKLCLKNM